ncbi:MAG: hypothetical protein IIY21_18365 [Clostridiales bacterium]|nr:hypothetical protein [Clostridiales bacterium]
MIESLVMSFFYVSIGFLSVVVVYVMSLWSIGAIASRRIAKLMRVSRA